MAMPENNAPYNDPNARERFREIARLSGLPITVLQAVWFRSGFAGCELYALRLQLAGVECFTSGSLSGADETSGIQMPTVSVAGDSRLQVHDPDSLPKGFRVWMDQLYEPGLPEPSEAERNEFFRTSVLIVDRKLYELARISDGSASVFYATQLQSRGHVDLEPAHSTDLMVLQPGQVVIVATPLSAAPSAGNQ